MPHGTNANKFEVAQAVADLICDAGPHDEFTLRINMVGRGNCDWRLVPSPNKLTVTTPPKKDNWVKQAFLEAEQQFSPDQIRTIEQLAVVIADERIRNASIEFRNQMGKFVVPTREEDGD